MLVRCLDIAPRLRLLVRNGKVAAMQVLLVPHTQHRTSAGKISAIALEFVLFLCLPVSLGTRLGLEIASLRSTLAPPKTLSRVPFYFALVFLVVSTSNPSSTS